MLFEIIGETPSKKNSRINTRSGRSFPNKRYKKWHDDAMQQIFQQKVGRVPDGAKISLTLIFYHGDMKRRDSDNQASSVLDTLIDSGIIADDNWKVIPEKHIYDRFDKDNARCLVKIEEIKDDIEEL